MAYDPSAIRRRAIHWRMRHCVRQYVHISLYHSLTKTILVHQSGELEELLVKHDIIPPLPEAEAASPS